MDKSKSENLCEGKLIAKKVRRRYTTDYVLMPFVILEDIENIPREDIVDWGIPQGREIW